MKRTVMVLLVVILVFMVGCGKTGDENVSEERNSISGVESDADTMKSNMNMSEGNELLADNDAESSATERVAFTGVITSNEEFVYRTVTRGLYNGIEITDYIGESGIVVIPEKIDGVDVFWVTLDGTEKEPRTNIIALKVPQSILMVSAKNCSNLTTVELPDILALGDEIYKFSNCDALEYINIPEGIDNIGGGIGGSILLEGCISLKTVELPNTVTQICDMAFSGCRSLTTVTFSTSLTRIGDGAFQNCYKLQGIEIPKECEGVNIGSSAFKCCGLEYAILYEGITSIRGECFAYVSENFVIKCVKGSVADTYAQENNIAVEYIE